MKHGKFRRGLWPSRLSRLVVAAVLLLVLGGVGRHLHGASASGDPVIAAAGDIACDPASGSYNGGNGTSNACRQKYTSDQLVNGGFAAVLLLGDNQYYCGSLAAYNTAFDPSWGRVKSSIYPSTGNHEYLTSGSNSTGCDQTNLNAAGYFNYFGSAAGDPTKGYYSFNVGSWHLIALNSQCSHAGGCGTGTAQYNWLQSDLAAHTGQCILAYWHIPLYSSGGRAAANTHPFWNLLYAAHADVNLTGHDHIYERFLPQDPNGNVDTANGMREFIAGTGGANHTSIVAPAANSVVRDATTFGLLELTLHPGSYDWQFVPAAGNGTFTDSGSATCHQSGVPPDTTPPSVPTGLTATPASPSEIDLAWTASSDNPGGSGVGGYKIYRSDKGSTPIANVTGTSYADTGLSANTTYTYTVSAYDKAGNESAQSSPPVSATTPCFCGTTVTVNPSADDYVNSASPTTNYGNATALYVDADGIRQSYLKFSLAGLSGTVTSVKLQVYAASSQSVGYQVYSVADTSWTETGLNWNTKPPMAGTSSGSSGPVTSGTWTSVTLPNSLVQTALGGTLSLGLQTTSNTNLNLSSKESANKPKLVVTLN